MSALARGADMTMGYTRRCVCLRLRAFVCVGALPALWMNRQFPRCGQFSFSSLAPPQRAAILAVIGGDHVICCYNPGVLLLIMGFVVKNGFCC